MRAPRPAFFIALLVSACASTQPEEPKISAAQLAQIEADLERLSARIAALEARAESKEASDAHALLEESDRRRIEDLDARVRAADAVVRARKEAMDEFIRSLERHSDARRIPPMQLDTEQLRRSFDLLQGVDPEEAR